MFGFVYIEYKAAVVNFHRFLFCVKSTFAIAISIVLTQFLKV